MILGKSLPAAGARTAALYVEHIYHDLNNTVVVGEEFWPYVPNVHVHLSPALLIPVPGNWTRAAILTQPRHRISPSK